MNQRERTVVFVVAGVEGTDHGELLQPRHHAGRRDLPARRDDGDLVALVHTELARQLHAEHDAPLPRLQLGERGLALRGEVGDGGLLYRRDAAHQRAAHLVAARHQRLRSNEGRRADHLGVLARLGRRGVPVGQRIALRIEQLHVRDDAEHAPAHLLLEAVHH